MKVEQTVVMLVDSKAALTVVSKVATRAGGLVVETVGQKDFWKVVPWAAS